MQINQNEIVVGATVGVHNKVGFGFFFFDVGLTDFSKDVVFLRQLVYVTSLKCRMITLKFFLCLKFIFAYN